MSNQRGFLLSHATKQRPCRVQVPPSHETSLTSFGLSRYNTSTSAAALWEAFFQLPTSEQAALLDDLIVGSSDATWEARLAPEMEERIDAVQCGEMILHESADVLDEMRARLRC